MKTSELKDLALDWAVAKIVFPDPDYEDADRSVYVYGDDEFHFTPSTNWAQGGPIIERERISVASIDPHWQASMPTTFYEGEQDGPTPLIAAMRCYVASKLGYEVEIPEELT
jgi:hypothetical protein